MLNMDTLDIQYDSLGLPVSRPGSRPGSSPGSPRGLSPAPNNGEFSPTEPSARKQKELVVGRSIKTRIITLINSGSFGSIYLGEIVSSSTGMQGMNVAVKMEYQRIPHPQILFEGNVYRHLEKSIGIPRVFWYGLHEPKYNVLVMELLGPSLQDLFVYCDRKFSLKTVLLIIDQFIDIIQGIHDCNFIHRDIKPDNIVIGCDENRLKLYMIDFGLAKKCEGKKTLFGHAHIHIAHPIVGTARYCSIHTHQGQDEARRDDMEAIAYMLIYFLQGSLPWQGLHGTERREKFRLIKEKKIETRVQDLCEGLPPQFENYLTYVRCMKLDEEPDYVKIKEMFRLLAEESGIEYDNQFDWVVKEDMTGNDIETHGLGNHGHESS